MQGVYVYVDGFNLYHAIDDLKDNSLKWLDLWQLASSFLRNGEVLGKVNYFSAYATWKPEAYARHRAYVAALRAVGVTTIMGKFKEKPRECLKGTSKKRNFFLGGRTKRGIGGLDRPF